MRAKKIPDTPLQRWLIEKRACRRVRQHYGKLTLAQAIEHATHHDLEWLAYRLFYVTTNAEGLTTLQRANGACATLTVPEFGGRWGKHYLLSWMKQNGAQLPLGL